MFKAQRFVHYLSRRPSNLTWGKRLITISVFQVGLYILHPATANCLPVIQPVQYARVSQTHLENTVSIRKSLRKLWESILFYLGLFGRFLCLIGLFLPSIATTPALLMDNETISDSWWNWLKYCINVAGPCSIKFAQWVSTRPDLFPLAVCKHFQDLQSQSIQPSWEEVNSILKKNYGNHWTDRLTIHFNGKNEPVILGSGCVAQVYEGHLQNQPQKVAIKIINPHAKAKMLYDLEILRSSAELIEYWFPSLQSISLVDSVEEFYRLMGRQLNMHYEAAALDQFCINFHVQEREQQLQAGSKNKASMIEDWMSLFTNHVTFPRPLHDMSNENILIETLEDGILLRDYIPSCDAKTKKFIANIGINAILKMIFLDNFIHADMHPGNIIYLKDDTGMERLCFIDAGLVAVLEPQDKRNLVELFQAVIQNDGKRVGELMMERSRKPELIRNPGAFARNMCEVVDEVHEKGLHLSKISISTLLQKVLLLCYQHQVKLESRYATILIALGIVEGLGRTLDPEMDILKKAAPYVVKAAIVEHLRKA